MTAAPVAATDHHSPSAIRVDHLTKRYPRGPVNAVDDVSLEVRRGETFGLLGPNGAGKTTLVDILTTAALPTAGRATLAGADVGADPICARKRLGVLPQRPNLDLSLRLDEILTYHATYHGVPRGLRKARATELLQELGLADRAQDRIIFLSGGLQQRVLLARALMHDPQVLFLDEPTTNLDPQSRLFLWDRIRALRQRGVTVLLTTHDMEEAERLCDRVAIMDRGRIVALDTPERLQRLIPGATKLELHVTPGDGAPSAASADLVGDALRRLPGITQVDGPASESGGDGAPRPTVYRVYGDRGDAGKLLANASQAVVATGATLRDLRLARSTLEDVYIHLTGRTLRA